MIPRFARWYEERPLAGDAILAALLLLAFVVPSELAEERERLAGLAFSAALVACVPFRRRAPVGVFVAVSVLCLTQFAVLDRIVAGDVVALIAVYSLVAYTSYGAIGTACAAVGALLAALRWETTDASRGQVAATTVISVLLAATLGAWRRSRRAELAALKERNRLLAIERDQQAALERARIARELHDVVAHSLSVIVVQADGAAAIAEQRPEAAADALRTIGDTGREALGQMRRLLGVLREQPPELEPQPGADQLDALVEQVARAGVPARLSREGQRRPVSEGVDLTLYRLAQEALTNVLKHAGPVSEVDVVLRYGDDAIELVVRDDGRGVRDDGDGSGQGLTGMRERVGLHDGTLEAGPNEHGFVVRATLSA